MYPDERPAHAGAQAGPAARPRTRQPLSSAQCHSMARPTATPRPTITMDQRRTEADSRRPSRPPTWPPMIEPAAISPATDHAIWVLAMKTTPATALTVRAKAFLVPLRRWRSSSMKMASKAMRMTPWAAPK